MLVLPNDQQLKRALDDKISKLETEETNRDVLENFRNNMKEINSPPVKTSKEERAAEEKRRIQEEDNFMNTKSVIKIRSSTVANSKGQ